MGNLEVVGGVPLVSAIGTPRTIGHTLGLRFRPRLQVLCQYVAEQLAARARLRGRDLESLRAAVRPALRPCATLEPSAWMELETMAAVAGVMVEDLLLAHGHGDLAGFLDSDIPPMRSTYLSFPAARTDSRTPLAALIVQADPALLPYLCLVHRIPAHGPASLSLTFAGLHPLLGLTEAGLAIAGNEMRVTDGTPGHLTTHLIAATLNAPSVDDAMSRLAAGPRFGGRALHALTADGQRATIEATGQLTGRLRDQRPEAPRVHTDHPLADEVVASGAVVADAQSRSRLGRIAQFAVNAQAVRPVDIAACFGVVPVPGEGERADFTPRSVALLRDEHGVTAPDAVVFAVIDPRRKELHVRRGFQRPLEVARL